MPVKRGGGGKEGEELEEGLQKTTSQAACGQSAA